MIPMASPKFVTAINCMDGRLQDPINIWLKQTYHATFVDVITEPGPIQYLAISFPTPEQKAIKKRVELSIKKHGSTLIAVIGHHDCGGNPANRETQYHQIQ